MREKWTRNEEIIVFNLYCKIPFNKVSKSHPDVIRIAKIINRSPSAVGMKIGNFGSFDENLKSKGIVGLANASKLDREIWNEFNGNWDKLAYESEKLISQLTENNNFEKTLQDIPTGKERVSEVKQRVNQNFFRQAVLASYSYSCCITGLATPQLLIASHIKPWSESNEFEKTNPQNGLCLNALHDKAFDSGFITVSTDYTIHVSNDISDIYQGKTVEQYFKNYDGKKLILPDKFLPKKEFLEYHNEVIFKKWK